jgi:tetratricopeptide (TPR) repeat protein
MSARSKAQPPRQDNYVKPVPVIAIAVLLLLGSFVRAQEAEWSRWISLGDEAMAKRQYPQAEAAYREALKVAEQHWKRDARLAGALIKLAEACNAESKKDDAEAFANHSVATLEDALKAHKPKNASDELRQVEISASLFDKAGDIFANNQKYPDAETLYRKVIAVREKYASEKFPAKPNNEDFFRSMSQVFGNASAKVADADDKLADLYRSERKIQEAMALYQKSETLREKQYGPDQPQVAKSLNDLATCFSLQGQYDQAEPLYKRVIDIFEHAEYKDTPQMATTLENYAVLLKRTARDTEAKGILQKASAIRTNLANAPQ